MSSPTVMYASVGFLAGSLSGFAYAGSPNLSDLLIGGFVGLFVGILLAVSKYNIWDRK